MANFFGKDKKKIRGKKSTLENEQAINCSC